MKACVEGGDGAIVVDAGLKIVNAVALRQFDDRTHDNACVETGSALNPYKGQTMKTITGNPTYIANG